MVMKKPKLIYITGFLSVLIAILVLIGWGMDAVYLKSILPGYASMKVNTALCFMLSGLVLFLFISPYTPVKGVILNIFLLFIFVISISTIIEYVWNIDFRIDQLFIKDVGKAHAINYPGRMSPITAICFFLIAFSFVGFQIKNRTAVICSQYSMHVVNLLSFLAVLGYIFGVSAFYKLSYFTAMAIHTSFLLFLLSLSASTIYPTIGLTKLFRAKEIGSAMARRIFPKVIILVAVTGFVIIHVQRHNFFSGEFVIVIFTQLFMLIGLFLVINAAKELNSIDTLRSNAEQKLKELNLNLEGTIFQRTKSLQETTQALKISEERHRKMITEIGDYAILLLDKDGNIENWNLGAHKIKGYHENEIIGKNFSRFYRPEDIEIGLPQKLLSEAKQKGCARQEGWRLRKDGSKFWANVTITAIHDEQNEILGFSKITRDLTEKKKADEQIKELSDRLLMATSAAKIGIWEWNQTSYKLTWDNKMFDLYGIKKETFLGEFKTFKDAIHPDDWEFVMNKIEAALNKETEFDAEFRIIWPDESVHYIKALGVVQRDKEQGQLKMTGTNWDITAQKQAELQLNESNKRNQIFIQEAPNAIAMFDKNMHYMAASKKWLSDYKLYSKDIIGHSHYEIFPEIGEDWKSIHKACLEGKTSSCDEARFERADGSVQWIKWDVRPWYLSPGNIGGLIMYTADITESKKHDTERRRIELILKRSNEIARIATWEIDLKTGKATWSKIANEIFEVSPDFTPKSMEVINFCKEGENRDRLTEALKISTEKGIPYDIDIEIETKKGNQRWIRVIGESEFEKGICTRRFGIFQDITSAKKSEMMLRNLNVELKTIFNSGYISIVVTDINGIITHFNRGAELMLQYSADEMVGKQTPYVFHNEQEVLKRAEEFSKLFGREIEGFDVFTEFVKKDGYDSREWSYVRKDGSMFSVQLAVSAMKNNDGEITGFMCVATDLTERKKAEANLRRLATLESKSKEMEQFAYITSHDLREPLLTMKNYMEILIQDYADQLNKEALNYANIILVATKRMEVLINGLLDYSRISRVKQLQNVDCNEIVQEVIEDLNSLITTANAKLIIGKLPVINAYPLELKLLFQSLINNAIKFRKADTVPEIEISWKKVDGGWYFKVKDNGIGIEENDQEKIFIIFQRLHNRSEYEGTGIGLSHCKKIAEIHNGNIWVRSKPGIGSVFHFTILTEGI